MTRLFRMLSSLLASLILSLFSASSINAQSDSPVIDVFRIEKTVQDGRPWLIFSWRLLNTDRAILLEDGRPIPARSQLPDGSIGWPPVADRAFRVSGSEGSFTIVAQNEFGRVEARARLGDGGCFTWLVPPDSHWARCRQGGIIASGLSTEGAPQSGNVTVRVTGRCIAIGEVRSDVGFSVQVPRNPLNPQAGFDTFNLDHVFVARKGTQDWQRVPLRGVGDIRGFELPGLAQGTRYVAVLPGGWRGEPPFRDFSCPKRKEDVRRHIGAFRALGVSTD